MPARQPAARLRYGYMIFRFLGIVLLVSAAWAQATGSMPRIEGESLAGHTVVLPDAASGKVAVLIFGFSRASKGPTSTWGDKIFSEFGGQAGFELYQLPVLEDAPRLLRGMIISGIKKGVKENVRDHFVPILQGEAALKKLVGYEEPDDAYLVIINRSGQILGRMHGLYSKAMYTQLETQVRNLLNH